MYSESLFFCLRPDAAAIAAIQASYAALASGYGLEGRLVDAHPLHATLCFVGRPERLPPSPLPALMAVGAAIRHPPVAVVLDRAIGFSGGNRRYPNVLLFDAASTAAATVLHRQLAGGLRTHGFDLPAEAEFRPHVTLSRSAAPWAYAGPIPPIAWLARELVLVHSVHAGVREHRLLAQWPLRA